MLPKIVGLVVRPEVGMGCVPIKIIQNTLGLDIPSTDTEAVSVSVQLGASIAELVL
jgi:hypothetical protein